VLTTKHTTTNHNDAVAREGSALVQRMVLLGLGDMPLRMETLQGGMSPPPQAACAHGRGQIVETKTPQQQTTKMTLQGRVMQCFGGREWGEQGRLHRGNDVYFIYLKINTFSMCQLYQIEGVFWTSVLFLPYGM